MKIFLKPLHTLPHVVLHQSVIHYATTPAAAVVLLFCSVMKLLCPTTTPPPTTAVLSNTTFFNYSTHSMAFVLHTLKSLMQRVATSPYFPMFGAFSATRKCKATRSSPNGKINSKTYRSKLPFGSSGTWAS